MNNAVCVIVLYMLSREIHGQIIQNVALRKSAIQYEGIQPSTTTWPANNAINGVSSCGTAGQSASAYGPSPWWQVDLPNIYDIQRIVVHGRTDNKIPERLTGFHVYMSTSEIKSIDRLFPIYKNTEYNGDIIQIENINQKARFCRLEIPNINGIIALCEVEVYGIPVKSLLQVHSEELNPEMSSTFGVWRASNAIDSNPSHDANACLCCSGTIEVKNQWWKINLLKKYLVSMIKVYGRTDETNVVQRNIDFMNATMSSTYNNWVAYNAIDNVPSALDIDNCNCCAATSDKGTGIAWWQLDLEKQYLVSHFSSRDTASLVVVCEVMVFDIGQHGTFGDRCSNKCGFFLSGACDSITGLCTCTPGWQGNTCDTNSSIAGSATSNKKSVIIGAVSGYVVVVLIVCIVAIIICWNRHTSSKDNTYDKPNLYMTPAASGSTVDTYNTIEDIQLSDMSDRDHISYVNQEVELRD